MNICYKIFHVDNGTQSSIDRENLVLKAEEQLNQSFTKLESESVYMKDKDSVKDFFYNSPYKVDYRGWRERGWKLGELGVWASNLNAWEAFLKSDYDYVILMEDDIVLERNFNERIEIFLNQLPEGWDIFSAFIPGTKVRKYQIDPRAWHIGKRDVCKLFQSWSCLCYVVSKKGAQKLLDDAYKIINAPIDAYLYGSSHIEAYSVKLEVPKICNLGHSLPSTIQDSKFLNLVNYLKPLH